MYTIEEINEIKALAVESGLHFPEDLLFTPAKDLQKIFNGVGASWQSESSRKTLSKIYEFAEATALIHDYQYALASLDLKAQQKADDLFLLNGIKENLFKSKTIFSISFWWNCRKVVLAYLLLCRLGSIAWKTNYFDKLKEEQNENK